MYCTIFRLQKPSGCGKTTLLRMIAGLETPAQTQPAETITTPTEEAPAAEEPAAAEEAPALSGKVTVYMPSPAGLADKLAAAFTEKTGVEVEQFQGTTGEILTRLEAEQANPVADVVILASWSDGLSMKADGQLESYTPANADKVNDGWINVVNPFRATIVLGTPGSGKSYAVVNNYIKQMISKGFSVYIYGAPVKAIS